MCPAPVQPDGQVGKESGHQGDDPRYRRGTWDVAASHGHRTPGFSRLPPTASMDLCKHLGAMDVTGGPPVLGCAGEDAPRWARAAATVGFRQTPGLLSSTLC